LSASHAEKPNRLKTALRLLAVAVPIAVLLTAAVALPGWIHVLPRVVRRRITETVLRAVLAGYSALFLTAVLGMPLAVWKAARARRHALVRPEILRGIAVCIACFVSLVSLELGSAAWRGWMHRLPALPTRFDGSSFEEYRIVVVGGSSALGEPYRPWLSVGQIVAHHLQEALPGRRVECEILAWLGDSLEQQHEKLAALKRGPNAMIIYAGHNEFAARFEEQRDAWLEEEPGSWLLRQVYRATLYSPFCRLAYETISKNRLDSPPLSGRHQLIDPPLCSPSEAADILADFHRRLEAIVAYCEQIGALPILIIPPANEADYEPSRSTLPPGVSQPARRQLIAEFTAARSAEATNPAQAAAMYLALLTRYPDFAEIHFRLARLREREGKPTAAAHHYLAALDHDGLPIRCPAPFRSAIEQVAHRHPASILIDGRRELAAVSSRGLLGDEVIQDTHHPTLRGSVALAGAVLRELKHRKTFGQSLPVPLPLDPAACARQFMADAANWATMCERTSVHYARVAGYRYDPAERLDKSGRYADAARRIRAREPPQAVMESLFR
jgi:hypothetical protein